MTRVYHFSFTRHKISPYITYMSFFCSPDNPFADAYLYNSLPETYPEYVPHTHSSRRCCDVDCPHFAGTGFWLGLPAGHVEPHSRSCTLPRACPTHPPNPPDSPASGGRSCPIQSTPCSLALMGMIDFDRIPLSSPPLGRTEGETLSRERSSVGGSLPGTILRTLSTNHVSLPRSTPIATSSSSEVKQEPHIIKGYSMLPTSPPLDLYCPESLTPILLRSGLCLEPSTILGKRTLVLTGHGLTEPGLPKVPEEILKKLRSA